VDVLFLLHRSAAALCAIEELAYEAVFHVVATLYAKQLQAEMAELLEKSELSEMEQLRLQMAMDRLAKMMSTLSNILKKMADTAGQITQNLK